MDTTDTIINKSFNLWSDEQKKQRTINKCLNPNVLKILPNGRIIKKFYTGVPDTVSKNGNQTSGMEISSQRERM